MAISDTLQDQLQAKDRAAKAEKEAKAEHRKQLKLKLQAAKQRTSRAKGDNGKRTILRHFEPEEDEGPPKNDKLPPTGIVEAELVAGRHHRTGFIRLTTATAKVYEQQAVPDCAVAQRLGVRKLYGDVSVAVEKGDFKKLRLYRDKLGVNLGFLCTCLNDFGCSNVNLAVVTQNKPLLIFMAESGADLSMACMGPPQEYFWTPVQLALAQGFNSLAALLDDLIREQPSSAQASLGYGADQDAKANVLDVVQSTLALSRHNRDSQHKSAMRMASAPDDAYRPVITMNKQGVRTHANGAPLDGPAPPWSGAPMAPMDDEDAPESQAAVIATTGDAPDPLVKELLKCKEAEKMLSEAPAEDFPDFDSVLMDVKRGADAPPDSDAPPLSAAR